MGEQSAELVRRTGTEVRQSAELVRRTGTEVRQSADFVTDVNVGGPDGNPPYCTVGQVVVPYNGADSRRWLWQRLDEVRQEYERKYMRHSDGSDD